MADVTCPARRVHPMTTHYYWSCRLPAGHDGPHYPALTRQTHPNFDLAWTDAHDWACRDSAGKEIDWRARVEQNAWEACANCGNARRFHPVGEPYNCDEFATKVEQVNDAG